MSRDFVRRLPNVGIEFTQRFGWIERAHVDWPLMLLLLVGSCYGLVILYSAVGRDPDEVIGQGVKFLIAAVLMLVLAQINPVFYERSAPWLYAVCILLLVLVLVIGTDVNGARRWLRIPGVGGFQPAEVAKLIVPLTLAWYYQDRQLPPKLTHLFWGLLLIIVPVLLIAKQPDLGTALLTGMAGLLVIFLAGIRWKHVSIGMALVAMCAPAMWSLLKDYQKKRILTLFDPDLDPLGAGWNIIQSKIAIGSGGPFGKGLFLGTQSHLEFLPESHTDFILSVLAEELGLLGITFLLIIYLLLISRGLFMAVQAQDTFGRLAAGSITLSFFVYVFVNISMVSGIMPVVGIPLPLVSQGGTAIVSIFAGFGILMSIHTHRRLTL